MTDPNKKKKSSRHRARELTLQALYEWQLSHNEKEEIAQNIIQHEASGERVDLEYFHHLFNAVIEEQPRLDPLFSPYLDRELDALSPVELAILRLGSYELVHQLEIPYRVVINEAIELAKTFGSNEAHKYINGVLDELSKKVRSTERSL